MNSKLSKTALFMLILIFGIFSSLPLFAESNDKTRNEDLVKAATTNQIESLRKKFEVQFFNLLIVKDDWSKDIREQMLLDMSNQGFQAANFYIQYAAAKASDDLQKTNLITDQIVNSQDPTVECLISTHLSVLNMKTEANEKVLKSKIVRSAESGVAHCVYWSAAFRADKGDRALLILKAAKEGDLLAQREMYKKYRDGSEVIKDLDQSFCWALKAEESAKKVWSNTLRNEVKEARFLYMQEYKKDPLQRNNTLFCRNKI